MKLKHIVCMLVMSLSVALAQAADKKPNILVIFGDDIGTWNVGAYTHGMMGRTPNIDRIGNEGHALHRSLRASRAAPPAARRSSWVRCRSAPE